MFLLLLSCSHFLQLTPWHFNSILNTERSAVISLLALFLSVTVMGTEPELKELKAPGRVKMERRIGEYHTLVTSQRHDWSLCSLSSFHTHTHTHDSDLHYRAAWSVRLFHRQTATAERCHVRTNIHTWKICALILALLLPVGLKSYKRFIAW